MNADNLNGLTDRVLNAVFEVSNTLDAGFLEKVYERALIKELVYVASGWSPKPPSLSLIRVSTWENTLPTCSSKTCGCGTEMC